MKSFKVEQNKQTGRFVALKQEPRCPLCGGISPNVHGECLCSYELSMFQPGSKAQIKTLARVLKAFQSLALKKH